MNAINPEAERQAFRLWFDTWADLNVGIVETAIKRQAAWAAWVQRATTTVQSGPTIHIPLRPLQKVITDPVAIRETFERDALADDTVSPDNC